MRVMVIPEHPGDEIAFAEVPDESMAQLRALQHIIGGYIEQVRTTKMTFKRNVMLVDEDGRYKQKLPNFRAMSFSAYPARLVGAVVVVGISEDGSTWQDVNE